MNEENNINALDEIHKGSCMGIDALNFVIDKTEAKEFRNVLEVEKDKYEKIKKQIEEIYPDYSDAEPHKTSLMNKAMTWYGIEMKTMTEHGNSKLAELLIQGTSMGIVEGRKILNHKDLDNRIKKIIDEYVTMQQDSIEILKKYL